jgi:hypothetical protein
MAAGVSPTGEAYVLYRFQGVSSGDDCVGAVRAAAGGGFFSEPLCVSPTNFEPGAGGVAFLGDDVYFAWSGQPDGGGSYVAEGSRWLNGSSLPDSFTNLDAPAKSIGLDELVPDEDGSVAAFWSSEITPGETELRAAAFDAGAPNLVSAAVPAGAVAGTPVAMSASFVDLWSGLGEAPSWSFGDGSSASGAQVSHTYSAPGTYTVTVIARDGLGNQASSTYQIKIAPIPVALPLPIPVALPPPIPVLTLLSSKVSGQSVLMRLGCAGVACGGEALLTVREKLSSGKLVAVLAGHAKPREPYKTATVGVSHFTLAPGQTLSATVALNATGRKLLGRFGRLPVTLAVVAATSKAAVATRSLTILPAKRPAKHAKH